MHSSAANNAMSNAQDNVANNDILAELTKVLVKRRQADPAESYVAGLYAKGLEAILAKVEEESAEVLDAARTGDDAHLIHEVADLWFHSLVMLIHRDLAPQQVLEELQRRFGLSGLDEKASRGSGQS